MIGVLFLHQLLDLELEVLDDLGRCGRGRGRGREEATQKVGSARDFDQHDCGYCVWCAFVGEKKGGWWGDTKQSERMEKQDRKGRKARVEAKEEGKKRRKGEK